MPQLSSLNWIFLYLLFWSGVFTTAILLWWHSNLHFGISSNGLSALNKSGKWSW